MPSFEYKAVPAPRRGLKAKGIKTVEDRFAHAVTELMNRMAAEGWEYLRADSLPSEERSGWTGKTTEIAHNLLVFRRETRAAAATPAPVPAASAVEDITPRLAARRDEGVTQIFSRPLGPARSDDS
jgi:hypothetical protein